MLSTLVMIGSIHFAAASDDATFGVDDVQLDEIVVRADASQVELTALALTAVPAGDEELDNGTYDRLFSASNSPASSGGKSPLWMWPLALFGMVGIAGVAYRSRGKESAGSDITVISRTMLAKGASVAVIEVGGAGGQSRRMLIGIGGGAPRLVAELPTGLEGAAESNMLSPSVTFERACAPSTARLEKSVDDLTSGGSTGTDGYGPNGLMNRNVSWDDDMHLSNRDGLVAEVLANRSSELDSNPGKVPWARNFEALLHRYVG